MDPIVALADVFVIFLAIYGVTTVMDWLARGEF